MENSIYLPITWKHAVMVWWAIFWRSILFCLLYGFAVGFVAGVILGVLGMGGALKEHLIWFRIMGFVVAIPVCIWVTKTVLSKKFSSFRIVLLASNQDSKENNV